MKTTINGNKAALLIFTFAALLASGATTLRAQSALDGFDPNANNAIRVVAVQPDGKILIGGDFTSLAPNGGVSVTRNRIARLNPDGTLDTAFNPNANGLVSAIAMQPDGKILVGGLFTSVGGQARNRMARLDATTGLADSFNPDANNIIQAIVVQADGKVLAGGQFTSIGGQARNGIARLDPATGAADSFNPNPNSYVTALVLQPDGKILVGGFFTAIGGQTRNRLARLDPSSGLADSFDANVNDLVQAIALQADGKVLVSGLFTAAGGQARSRIARLNPATGLADSFNPNASSDVNSIAVQADGKIVAAGGFGSIGGQTRNRIARLDPVTGLADSFNPNANNGVLAVALQADGKIVAGGFFAGTTSIGAETRNRIARLESNGAADRTLTALANTSQAVVNAIALQPDEKIVIGGQGTFVSGQGVTGITRNHLVRVNRDGLFDFSFDPQVNNNSFSHVDAIVVQPDGAIVFGGSFFTVGVASRQHLARVNGSTGAVDGFNPQANNIVEAIALQTDGKILAGGLFTVIGGQPRAYIARFDSPIGTADSFDPDANDAVKSIVVQPDGKILVGGDFTIIGAVDRTDRRNHIARLSPVTGLADSFNPNANGRVSAIALQADGKILVGGDFTTIAGQTRNRIARLDAFGALDIAFNPNANGPVSSIVVQADGRIVVAGGFINIGGQPRNRIARLDPITGAADSFNPNASNTVSALALQTDGKILAGGLFSGAGSISGQPRQNFARVSNDTPALPALLVAQTTVTFLSGGSSPQLTRVRFEDSADGVNFNFLGYGTLTGGNWTLTGLNLSLGQNIYIRARGTYHSGRQNASESLTGFVRNVFLLPPPPVPSQVASRKLHNGAPFDIDLPLTGSPGVECRSGGGGNDYQVVLTFAVPVTFANASVTSGLGSVASTSGNGNASVVVNLTGVTSGQSIALTVAGVNDGTSTGDVVVPMGVLVGDTNGNRSVNATDIGQTKAQAGQPVTASNFREDVTANGAISASDISLVKSLAGTSLPPVPPVEPAKDNW